MTVGPDLRPRSRLANEGIVRRHRAVRLDAHDLAYVVGEALRVLARREVVTKRDEQVAVGRLRDAAGNIVAARRAGLAKHDRDAVQARLRPCLLYTSDAADE